MSRRRTRSSVDSDDDQAAAAPAPTRARVASHPITSVPIERGVAQHNCRMSQFIETQTYPLPMHCAPFSMCLGSTASRETSLVRRIYEKLGLSLPDSVFECADLFAGGGYTYPDSVVSTDMRYLMAPPGAGKTLLSIASMLARAMDYYYNRPTPCGVLIVAAVSKSVQSQWTHTFEKVAKAFHEVLGDWSMRVCTDAAVDLRAVTVAKQVVQVIVCSSKSTTADLERITYERDNVTNRDFLGFICDEVYANHALAVNFHGSKLFHICKLGLCVELHPTLLVENTRDSTDKVAARPSCMMLTLNAYNDLVKFMRADMEKHPMYRADVFITTRRAANLATLLHNERAIVSLLAEASHNERPLNAAVKEHTLDIRAATNLLHEFADNTSSFTRKEWARGVARALTADPRCVSCGSMFAEFPDMLPMRLTCCLASTYCGTCAAQVQSCRDCRATRTSAPNGAASSSTGRAGVSVPDEELTVTDVINQMCDAFRLDNSGRFTNVSATLMHCLTGLSRIAATNEHGLTVLLVLNDKTQMHVVRSLGKLVPNSQFFELALSGTRAEPVTQSVMNKRIKAMNQVGPVLRVVYVLREMATERTHKNALDGLDWHIDGVMYWAYDDVHVSNGRVDFTRYSENAKQIIGRLSRMGRTATDILPFAIRFVLQ